MNRDRWLHLVCFIGVVSGLALAQGKPSTAEQKRTVRVGIAAMSNRSGRQASPEWERDQLVRELQRERTSRKSDVVLEPVSLDAASREDARQEAARKNCEYFVLTTMVDPGRGPQISGAPDGRAPAPIIVGNAQRGRTLVIDYSMLEVGDFRTISEGTATASVDGNGDTRAADEAMRMTAHRVASELRKQGPPRID